MATRSPFDYDVSVSADKARRQRRRGMSGVVEGAERLCEHPRCDRPAAYRAPRAPGELHSYRWFCLVHVREYNAAWNFFANWDEEALDSQWRADRIWDRPTWRFGQQPKKPLGAEPHADGRAWERFGFADPFDVLGGNATLNPGRAEPGRPARLQLPKNVRSALDVLGARPEMTRAEIRARYRALVKDLHPDMNGGDRRDEARLRRVLWAWAQIKASRQFAG